MRSVDSKPADWDGGVPLLLEVAKGKGLDKAVEALP